MWQPISLFRKITQESEWRILIHWVKRNSEEILVIDLHLFLWLYILNTFALLYKKHHHSFSIFFKYLFTVIWKTKKRRGRSLKFWFVPQMPTTARVGPIQSQEPAHTRDLAHWWKEHKHLDNSLCFHRHINRQLKKWKNLFLSPFKG